MPDKIYALNIAPGIQRDGTAFSARTWVDGLWVRFQRGLPRKMGGYREIASTNDIVRGIYVAPNPPNFIVFYGTYRQLFALSINSDPTDPVVLAPPVNRTPQSFQSNPNYDWQFDTMYSASTQTAILVAHASQNLYSIANTQNRPIFYGDLTGNAPLVSNGVEVSGGIVVLHPFLFAFGNDGKVQWFEPNNPTQLRGEAIITGDKIVAALPVRGGTNSPAGLFWSLSSLIRATYTGEIGVDFNFDTISSESSILSSRSIIEYDNQYYWLGVDSFLMYNGTVQTLPNDKNLNYFFDNLNYSQRQKVWATKITKFGEIWWIYPTSDSEECNRAVIYNVRERTWYDTDFDQFSFSGRSDGYFDQTFSKPIWSSTRLDGLGDYPLYVHEVGVNNILSDGVIRAISSDIKSASLSFCATSIDNARPETDINLYISRIEPDFIMQGSMQVKLFAKQYAASQEQEIGMGTFDSATETLNFTAMGREIYLQFICNAVDCDFQMGQVLIVGKLGDMRA